MNKNEIMQLGMQAKLCSQSGGINDEYDFEEEIIAFANLIAAAEREACARLCEEMASWHGDLVTAAYESAAEAIRKRGQDV
jgi:hypothetical protein